MADHPSPGAEPTIDWVQARALLRSRIARQLGTAHDPQIDDLTQEALIDLLRVVRRDGFRSLDGLATVIARSVVASEIRRRQRYRARFGDWQAHLDDVVELPGASRGEWDDPQQTLWFLLVEYFRSRHAPCLRLAELYATHGDWKQVAQALGRSHDAIRQQWSRCSRAFRDALRRDPGSFQDWAGGDG